MRINIIRAATSLAVAATIATGIATTAGTASAGPYTDFSGLCQERVVQDIMPGCKSSRGPGVRERKVLGCIIRNGPFAGGIGSVKGLYYLGRCQQNPDA